MNADHKLVAAARRAAKTHARDHAVPYQKALDIVASRAGRPTWKAFLQSPAAVDAAAMDAACEPDLSIVPPTMQLDAVLSYARAVKATAMAANPRSGSDLRPVLRYLSHDARWIGVDGRGLDLHAVARSLIGTSADLPAGRAGYVTRFDEGGIVRGAVIRDPSSETPPSVAISLNGSAPPTPVVHASTSQDGGVVHRAARRRRDRGALRRMVQHGPLSHEDGLLLGADGAPRMRGLSFGDHGVPVRLRHGHGLMAISPPGSGRLAMLTLPMLLDDRTSSFVVHDDFGDLLKMTSGWRASIGRVAVIRTDGSCTDAFNPFDAAWLPGRMQAARTYVHNLMMILSDDDVSIAEVLTDAAMARIDVDGGTCLRDVHAALRDRRDPLSQLAVTQLIPFVTDVMHHAFGRNTIEPADLRGRTTQGDRPFTLYLVRRTIMHRSDRIVALVQEAIWQSMLCFGPGQSFPNGDQAGPCAFVSMLNDLHRMPRLPGLVRALDLQKHKTMSTIITGASGGALKERYGDVDAAAILRNCSIRYVVNQSDPGDVDFIDPEGRLGHSSLYSLDSRKGVLMSSFDDAPFRQVPFFFQRHLLQRAYNPRTGLGPKPVGREFMP